MTKIIHDATIEELKNELNRAEKIYNFKARNIRIECPEISSEEKEKIFLITFAEDIYIDPEQLTGDLFKEYDYEIIFKLNFCGIEKIYTAENLRWDKVTFNKHGFCKGTVSSDSTEVITKKVIKIPVKGQKIYFGTFPKEVKLNVTMYEIDDKLRDFFKKGAEYIQKLAPMASSAYPGAGTALGLVSSLVNHCSVIVDNDLEVDDCSCEILPQTVSERKINLINEDFVKEDGKGKYSSLSFDVTDMGEKLERKTELTVRLDDIYIADIDGSFTYSELIRIGRRILGAKDMSLNIEASVSESNFVFSCPFKRINDVATINKVDIAKIKLKGGLLPQTQTGDCSIKSIPLQLSLYADRSGLQIQNLVEAAGYAAGMVKTDIQVGSLFLFNPSEYKDKLIQNSSTVGNYISKFTGYNEELFSFDGVFALADNWTDQNGFNTLGTGSYKNIIPLIKDPEADNEWKCIIKHEYKYGSDDSEKLEIILGLRVILN